MFSQLSVPKPLFYFFSTYLELNNSTYSMAYENPKVQYRNNKDSLIIPILSEISSIPRIDKYFFKIYSNVTLPSSEDLTRSLVPVGLPVKILIALLPSSTLSIFPILLNPLYLIGLSILNEPSFPLYFE